MLASLRGTTSATVLCAMGCVVHLYTYTCIHTCISQVFHKKHVFPDGECKKENKVSIWFPLLLQ